LSENGFAGAALSPELTLAEARQLWETQLNPDFSLELMVHGAFELMISQFCPIAAWSTCGAKEACGRACKKGSYALRDRKGYLFPVYTNQHCRMHLLNSADLVMAGELHRLADQELWLRLELRERSPQEVRATVDLYRKALSIQGGEDEKEELIREAHRISGRDMTRGHYFRGVD
jgi:putative protease